MPTPGSGDPDPELDFDLDLALEEGDVDLEEEFALAEGSTSKEAEALREEARLDLAARLAGLVSASPLLSELDSDGLKLLAQHGSERRVPPGEEVFRQGAAGTDLFLLLSGQAAVEHTAAEGGVARRVATLQPGAFFGEMALLTGRPRSATVRALLAAELLVVPIEVSRALVERQPGVRRLIMRVLRARMVATLLATSPLFEPFDLEERRRLVARFRLAEFAPMDSILRRGEPVDGLYVLLAGRLTAAEEERVLGRITQGEVFGEMSLLGGGPASATVRADVRSWVLRLPREDISAAIANHPRLGELLADIAERRRSGSS